MDSVLRALFVYFFLLIIYRVSGKTTLGEVSPFDFVLTLIISEAVSEALIGNDASLTNAAIVVTTLVFVNLVLSIIKQKSQLFARWTEGTPIIILENGKPIKDRMAKERLDESDILEFARRQQGISTVEEIQYAILETSGGITIIPKSKFQK